MVEVENVSAVENHITVTAHDGGNNYEVISLSNDTVRNPSTQRQKIGNDVSSLFFAGTGSGDHVALGNLALLNQTTAFSIEAIFRVADNTITNTIIGVGRRYFAGLPLARHQQR